MANIQYELSPKQISDAQGDVKILMARGYSEDYAWEVIINNHAYADTLHKAMRNPATNTEPVTVPTLQEVFQAKVNTERSFMQKLKEDNMKRSVPNLQKGLQVDPIYF